MEYVEGSAARLPFENAHFDFVTGFMSMQDMADQQGAVAEALRVLRPGGFFQFSITHPCFQTPKSGWVSDEMGRRTAFLVGDYFSDRTVRVEEWIFGAAPKELKERYPKFKTPYFQHTLSDWLNMLVRAGFQLEAFEEPTPDDETLAKHPEEYDARIIAYFLIVRCRKPA